MSDNINMVDALHKTIYNQDQQIAQLKAENEMLKSDVKEFQEWRKAKNKGIRLLQQQLKDNTKQMCEKIREKLSLHCDYKDNIGWYMPENKFNLILDQIENEKESN